MCAGQEYNPAIGSFSLKLCLQFTEEMKKEETGEKFWPSGLLFQIFPNSGGSREFRKQPQIAFARLPHLCCLEGGRPRLDRKHLLDLQSWNPALRRGSKLELEKKKLQIHDIVRSWKSLQSFTRPHNKSHRSCVSLNNLLLAEGHRWMAVLLLDAVKIR